MLLLLSLVVSEEAAIGWQVPSVLAAEVSVGELQSLLLDGGVLGSDVVVGVSLGVVVAGSGSVEGGGGSGASVVSVAASVGVTAGSGVLGTTVTPPTVPDGAVVVAVSEGTTTPDGVGGADVTALLPLAVEFGTGLGVALLGDSGNVPEVQAVALGPNSSAGDGSRHGSLMWARMSAARC